MKRNKSKIYEITYGLLAVLCSMAVCCFAIRIWQIDLTVLPGTGGDGTLFVFLVKSLQQFGISGIWENSMVGAPGVSSLADIPFLDFLLIIEIQTINLFTRNPIVTYYVLYVFTYGTTALTMYILLQKLNVKSWVGAAFSVIFACAPYHFYRSLGHVTLSNYMCIPLGVWLALVILEGGFKKKQGQSDDKKGIMKRNIGIGCCIFLVGASQIYFAFFLLIVMGIALLFNMIRNKTWKTLIHEGIIVYITGIIAFSANIIPKLLYGIIHGSNDIAGIRIPMEAELYGMKIIQLLLPVTYSRKQRMAQMTAQYTASGVSVSENVLSSLGIIASVAFLFLCGWLIYSFISKNNKSDNAGTLDFFAMSILTLVLFCTVGGFGTLFNYLITPQIRAYNRASILISCISLAAMAMIISKVNNKFLSVLMCGVLLCIGMYDQVQVYVSGWQIPYVEQQKIYESFFAEIEACEEDDAMAYELPYINFPEQPPMYRMVDYTPFMGYLFTDNIKWSYGGVIGRNMEASDLNVDNGQSEQFVKGIVQVGFTGVLIDVFGFEDGGTGIVEFYDELKCIDKKIVSRDGRFYYYKIGNMNE